MNEATQPPRPTEPQDVPRPSAPPAEREAKTTSPRRTFLGYCPERYDAKFHRYKSTNGILDPDAMAAAYAAGDMVRFYTFCLFFDLVQKESVPGDMAELGVWKGDTASVIVDACKRMNMVAYLLDTFEGFDQRDLAPSDSHVSGCFSDTSLDAVRARIGDKNVAYIKGFFPETAACLPERGRYSFVHIDCDLYAPILSGLKYFYPRVEKGGFIVMHDYMSLSWDGSAPAIDEFFADKPEFVIPVADFAGTVVVRKIAAASSQSFGKRAKRALGFNLFKRRPAQP